MFLRHGCHQGRVVAPAQESPQRHVGNHALRHRFFQKLLQLALRLFIIRDRVLAHSVIDLLNIPIFPGLYLSIRKAQNTARLQLVHILKDGIRRIDILLEQEPAKHRPIDFFRKSLSCHQRLEL